VSTDRGARTWILDEVTRSDENKCLRLKAVGQLRIFDPRSGALTSLSNNNEKYDVGLGSCEIPYCDVKRHQVQQVLKEF